VHDFHFQAVLQSAVWILEYNELVKQATLRGG
jgi:hypothetical protein